MLEPMFRLFEAQRSPQMLERVAAAGERRDGVGQFQRLERRQAAGRPLKQNPGENFVLRQAGHGGDRKRRLRGGARHLDARGDVSGARLGDEIEIGRHVAMEANEFRG